MGKGIYENKALEKSNKCDSEIREKSANDVRVIDEEIKIIKKRIDEGDSSKETVELLSNKEEQMRAKLAIVYDRD